MAVLQKRKHFNTIIAFAHGAEIQYKGCLTGPGWQPAKNPNFDESIDYRVDPKCKYAFEQVKELGGDTLVNLYKDWLDGIQLEFINKFPAPPPSPGVFCDFMGLSDKPFEDFTGWYKRYLPHARESLRHKETMVEMRVIASLSDTTIAVSRLSNRSDSAVGNIRLGLCDRNTRAPKGWFDTGLTKKVPMGEHDG